MKISSITTLVLLGVAVSVPAFAAPIGFSATYTGPEGYSAPTSARLDYTVSGNTLSITLDNTSGLVDSEGNPNAPAIVGLGFNTTGDTSPCDVQVRAYRLVSGAESGSPADISGRWALSEDSRLNGTGGEVFDFALGTTNGVRYGLINPQAAVGGGSHLFETAARLSVVFTSLPGDVTDWYVRFQNLGENGEYSITTPASPAPEPGTMLLIGTGLIGLVGLRRLIW